MSCPCQQREEGEGKVRETERDRERETDRDRERETKGERDRETERERQTETEREGQTDRDRERGTDRQRQRGGTHRSLNEQSLIAISTKSLAISNPKLYRAILQREGPLEFLSKGWGSQGSLIVSQLTFL
jgi:hypothetical protein